MIRKRIILFIMAIVMIVPLLSSCTDSGESTRQGSSTSTDEIINETPPGTSSPEDTSLAEETSDSDYDNYWSFRSVGTMNITRDRVGTIRPEDIDGDYTDVIRTVAEYAVEVGANYLELAIMPEQKPTLEELLPYYIVLPEIAREYNLNVYYRIEPSVEMIQRILYTEGDEFEETLNEYFALIEKLWVDMHPGLLRDGDIVSTFAEADNRMTTPLGMTEGTVKFREYVKLAADFIDGLRERTGLDLIYTESVCGGEARLAMFDEEIASRVDFIAWDHYAGISWIRETNERMRAEANQTARWIIEYSEKLGTKIALGEWCTHWSEPKSKETQALYIKLMTDALKDLTSKHFVGMEYFHFAMPHVELDYDNATYYYSSPVIDKTGKFPGFYVLQEAFQRHSERNISVD